MPKAELTAREVVKLLKGKLPSDTIKEIECLLLGKTTEEKKKGTIDIIEGAIERVLPIIEATPEEVLVDERILADVVTRYWRDVKRIHIFQTVPIDCHKIAGYLTYWICMLRPFRASEDF